MKKKIKKLKTIHYTELVVGIIIGAVLAGTSVYYAATIYYDSVNVGYDNTSTGLASDTVQDALDELDGKVKFGDATAANILSGKKALVGGQQVTGSMKNLTTSSIYQHSSSNGTKVLIGDAAFLSNIYDTRAKANSGLYAQIRYNGTAGYIEPNTLIGVPKNTMLNALGVKRTKVWSGSATGSVNVNLSAYSWVYIVVNNVSGYGGTGSTLLLQVGGAEKCAGIKVPISGSHRQYTPVYKATTSGITLVSSSSGDGVADNRLQEIWGIGGIS